jgi:hypothetical protein
MLLPAGSSHLAAGQARTGTPLVAAELLYRFHGARYAVTPLPAAPVELAGLWGASALAGYWRMQDDAVADHVADLVDPSGDQDLNVTGAGALLGRTAVGLMAIGPTFTSTRCAELVDDLAAGAVRQGGLEADKAVAGDMLVGHNLLVVVFKLGRWNSTAGERSIVFKGGTIGTSSARWSLLRNGATLTLRVYDGTHSAVSVTRTLPSENDRDWHYLAIKIDRTAQLVSLWGDWVAATTASIAAVDATAIGGKLTFGGDSDRAMAAVQLASVAWVSGAAVTSINAAVLNRWWRHGEDPSGVISTYTRAGNVTIPIARDAGGVLLASYGANAFAIGYLESMRNGTHTGTWCGPGLTNAITDSSLDRWTLVGGATVQCGTVDSPFGMRDGTRLVCPPSGYVSHAVTAGTAGGLRLVARAGTTEDLFARLYEGATLRDQVGIKLGATYEEHEIVFTYAFTGAATVRLYAGSVSGPGVGVGGELDVDVVCWVNQIASSQHSVYVTNGGSGVVAAGPTIRTSVGPYVRGASGRIHATVAAHPLDVLAGSQTIVDVQAEPTYDDRWVLSLDSTTGPIVFFDVNDEGATSVGPAPYVELASSAYLSIDAEWKSEDPGAGLRVRYAPELRVVGGDVDPDWHELAVAWSAAGAPDMQIDLGADAAGFSHLRGYLETVEIYAARPVS